MAALLTKTNAKKLPALYANDGKGNAAKAPVKFFGIMGLGGWTWYATEFDADGGRFFGLVVSPMCPDGELGYFTLAELESATAMGGKLPLIECDKWWSTETLAEIRAAI
jgi:hypothetical protein